MCRGSGTPSIRSPADHHVSGMASGSSTPSISANSIVHARGTTWNV